MKRTLAVFCDHANEVPMTCRCADNCYCKGNTCPVPHVAKALKEIPPRYPGDSLKTDAEPSPLYWLANGRVVDILRPRADEIDPLNIVSGISRVQRFGGQFNAFECYSVAEHSVLVSKLCLPQNAILGLMHDASESFVGDLVTPLKRQAEIRGYYEIEHRWMLAIGHALGVGDRLANLPIDVKVADLRALATERRDLFIPSRKDESGIQPASWKVKGLRPYAAAKAFNKRFEEITGKKLR